MAETKVTTGVDRNSDRGLGQGEERILGRHADIAHEGELEAEAEAVALHGTDDGLGQFGEDPEPLMHPSDALVVVADLLGRRAPGDPVFRHAEIDTGTKGPAFGLDHQHADPVIKSDLVGPRPQLAGGLPAPGVQFLGVAKSEDANAIVSDL